MEKICCFAGDRFGGGWILSKYYFTHAIKPATFIADFIFLLFDYKFSVLYINGD